MSFKRTVLPLLSIPFALALTGGAVWMIHRHRYPPPVVESPKPVLPTYSPSELRDKFLKNFVNATDEIRGKDIVLRRCRGVLDAETSDGYAWVLADRPLFGETVKLQHVVVIIPPRMKNVAKMIDPTDYYEVTCRFARYDTATGTLFVDAITVERPKPTPDFDPTPKQPDKPKLPPKVAPKKK